MEKKGNFLSKILLSIIIIFIPTILCFCFGSQTNQYKIDNFAFKVNDYNKNHLSDTYKAPYLKITRKEYKKALYDDLFNEFHYSDDTGWIRQYMDDDCVVENQPVTLLTQDRLYISPTKNSDYGYRLQYSLYDAYFSDPELGTKGYLGKKDDCDSYIFISDRLADSLLELYSLPPGEESYLKLIQEKKYYVLPIRINEDVVLKFSINNILYSNRRSASRILDFNDFFGVINHAYSFEKYNFHPCIEVDFRAYAFYIERALTKISSVYKYSSTDYNFDFYKYNYSEMIYINDLSLKEEYNNIGNNSDSVFITLFIICIILEIILSIIVAYCFIKSPILIIVVISALLSFLLVCSIIAIFNYFCYLFTIAPLLSMLIIFILKGRIIILNVKQRIFSWFNLEKFYTVSI